MQTFMSNPKGTYQLDMRAHAFERLEDAPAG